jgi:hypothetical protein
MPAQNPRQLHQACEKAYSSGKWVLSSSSKNPAPWSFLILEPSGGTGCDTRGSCPVRRIGGTHVNATCRCDRELRSCCHV